MDEAGRVVCAVCAVYAYEGHHFVYPNKIYVILALQSARIFRRSGCDLQMGIVRKFMQGVQHGRS